MKVILVTWTGDCYLLSMKRFPPPFIFVFLLLAFAVSSCVEDEEKKTEGKTENAEMLKRLKDLERANRNLKYYAEKEKAERAKKEKQQRKIKAEDQLALKRKLAKLEKRSQADAGARSYRAYKRQESSSSATVSEREVTPEAFVEKPDPMKAIVLIEGEGGAGTGFFVKHSTGIYLYTAAHVLSGNRKPVFKTIDGRKYTRFGRLEVAKGADLVRMRVNESVPAKLRMAKAGRIEMGGDIVAVGNSGGGAVLTENKGVIQGVGDVSFEIDAEVIPGNSGGPILAASDHHVLGLVTHATQGQGDVWASKTRYSKIRRFGVRFDRRRKWVKVALKTFQEEPYEIAKMNQVTRLLYALSILRPTRNGLGLSTQVRGGTTALQIFEENSWMNSVQKLFKMNRSLSSKAVKADMRAIKTAFARYYQEILSASRNQSRKMTRLSPYHMDLAKGYFAQRKDAEKALSKTLRALY